MDPKSAALKNAMAKRRYNTVHCILCSLWIGSKLLNFIEFETTTGIALLIITHIQTMLSHVCCAVIQKPSSLTTCIEKKSTVQ